MANEQRVALGRVASDESGACEEPAEITATRLTDEELRHELRNALTAALGYSAWLLNRAARWTDPRERTALEIIRSSLRHASRLVQEERVAAPRTCCDLRQAAAVAVSQVPPTRLGDVVIRILTEDPLVGPWEHERIVQVLMNVLGNAVKYSPDRTPIVVELARVGDWGRIVVRDEGIGIEPQDLDAIFEGHRTELARLVSSGSGIGLALSRRLVEAEGGQLGVSSQPGRGSAFWVDLPLRQPAPATSTRVACQPALSAVTGLGAVRAAVTTGLQPAVVEVP
jgi:signal transduction histidine kinase